jgi:hypothetical protein
MITDVRGLNNTYWYEVIVSPILYSGSEFVELSHAVPSPKVLALSNTNSWIIL